MVIMIIIIIFKFITQNIKIMIMQVIKSSIKKYELFITTVTSTAAITATVVYILPSWWSCSPVTITRPVVVSTKVPPFKLRPAAPRPAPPHTCPCPHARSPASSVFTVPPFFCLVSP